MATSVNPALSPTSAPAVSGGPDILKSLWGRLLLPSISDLFLLAIVVWLFCTGEAGWTGLLADGDIGWHIRVGEFILDSHSVPKHDLFSFSKTGAPWFAWEWLSDVIFASAFRLAGFKGVTWIGGAVIGLWATLLLRRIVWSGANTLLALLLTLLSIGAASIHFLARPHIFTLLFLTIWLWILERDRRTPDRWIWILPALMVLWTNLHGGFLAGIACLGLFLAGSLVESVIERPRNWARPIRYGLVLAASGAATLINPYGYGLHVHIASYLRSDWIRDNVQEFMSPVFRSESMMQFEGLLFGGILICGYLLWRREFTGAFLVGYFAHVSLESARHIPLYCVVATPWIGMEITRLWDVQVTGKPKSSVWSILNAIALDLRSGIERTSVWCIAVLVILALNAPVVKWPSDFPKEKFPVRMVAEYGGLLRSHRVFTSDQWGDYLLFHGYPSQRVFIDGRSDFYGPAIGKDYVRMIQATWRAETLLDSYRFDVVLAPTDWPLVELLKRNPKWRLVRDAKTEVLFQRVQTP